jgi:opacity protein-like surface antigen
MAQNSLVPSGRSITYRIGAGLVGEYNSIDVDVKNNPTVIFPEDGDFSSNVHHVCKKFNISPSIELGAFLYDTYYFGFLLVKNFTHVKSVMKVPMTSVFNFQHTFQLKSYIDTFLKIGYRPAANVMFYGLVGPSFANWSHKTKVFYYNEEKSHSSTADINNSVSHVKSTGLGFGAGAEFWLGKNATVSFQYAMHLHRPKTIRYMSGYNVMFRDEGGIANNVDRDHDVQKKVRLTHSTIAVRFSYFFSF